MGIRERTRQCRKQGDGGGARLLTTRIYPHSDADGSRRPAERQKPWLQARGAKLRVASHKTWEVKRTRWMHAYTCGDCERLVNSVKLVSNL